MKLVLIGDGESPHLLKWARALAAVPGLALYAVSSRGFVDAFEAIVPAERRLVLDTDPRHGGGNVTVLRRLPTLGRQFHHRVQQGIECRHGHQSHSDRFS